MVMIVYTCGRHDNKVNTKRLLDRLKRIEEIVRLLWCLCHQPSHRCHSSPCMWHHVHELTGDIGKLTSNKQTSQSLCIPPATVGHIGTYQWECLNHRQTWEWLGILQQSLVL